MVAGDAVTEFVYSGFASLLALDPEGARPFDRHRRGLTLGEGAAVALVMDERRARESGRAVLGSVTGWGMSCDANHMTGPAKDGSGLARAVRSALARAAQAHDGIGSISAHGTGTSFNDAMELRAFRSVLGEALPPVYSVKGALGHTLGAAGLVEVIVGLESLRRGQVPPSVNLKEPDADAEGVVSAQARPQAKDAAVLSTNSGFGGINAAVVLRGAAGGARVTRVDGLRDGSAPAASARGSAPTRSGRHASVSRTTSRARRPGRPRATTAASICRLGSSVTRCTWRSRTPDTARTGRVPTARD